MLDTLDRSAVEEDSVSIKRDSLDALFSDYVRERDSYTCQRCGKYYEPPTRAIHAAHIFSRRHKGTRHDPLNAVALCHGCHTFFTGYPLYFATWVSERLGKQQYALLMHRARKPTKFTDFDRAQIKSDLKEKLTKLRVDRKQKFHVEAL